MSTLAAAQKALQAKQAMPVGRVMPSAQSATISPTTGAPAAVNPQHGNMQKLQARVKELRTAKGWTQRDLAKKSGMSQGTITRAERHGWVSLWCLIRLSVALGAELQIN